VIVLDTGALVALERDDRALWARLKAAAKDGIPVLIPQGALAQAWRGGKRQARLGQALRYVNLASFDDVARQSGELCGRAGTDDIVDASIALVAARPGVTHLYTSDAEDLRHLLNMLDADTHIVRC